MTETMKPYHPRWLARISRLLALALLMAAFSGITAYAQEYKEAFNAGLEALKTYQSSKKAADLTKAYQQFEASRKGAQAANDREVAAKAAQYLARIDYTRGVASYKAEKFEEAITFFDESIKNDADYDKAYYMKGLALKKLDRLDEAMASLQIAMEKGEGKAKQAAADAIRDHYIYLASRALSRGGERISAADAEEARGYLQKLMDHGVEPDADYYYYMAVALKATGQARESVEMADKALELHRGSRSDKAKIYFVKGEALMALQDYEGAKEAFRNAAYGSYKATAEHYLETIGTR